MANISKHGVVTATGRANPNFLIRRINAGGQTVANGDYSIKLPATTSADTYFSTFLKERLVEGTVYTISCMVSGLIDGTYYKFPLFVQSNSAMGMLQIDHNGLCCMTFTMNSTTQTAYTIDGETVYRCLMDDNGRNIASGQGAIILTDFKIEEGSIPTPWVPASTDPIYVENHSSMFEINDLCKIHKNGNIQSYEFIEF